MTSTNRLEEETHNRQNKKDKKKQKNNRLQLVEIIQRNDNDNQLNIIECNKMKITNERKYKKNRRENK